MNHLIDKLKWSLNQYVNEEMKLILGKNVFNHNSLGYIYVKGAFKIIENKGEHNRENWGYKKKSCVKMPEIAHISSKDSCKNITKT